MTNELQIILDTGKTITADLVIGNNLISANIPLVERGTTGHYYGDCPVVSAGNYLVTFKEGTNILGSGMLYWDGAKEVFNKIDVDLSTRASQSSVNAIPTNPLLTNDSRLSNLTTIELIRKLITNSSKIDEATNKLIVYDDDEVTPILEFNTLNIDGNASTDQIFEIRKV